MPPAPQIRPTAGAAVPAAGAFATSWFLMPSQSVLSPRSRPSASLVTVFTAPIRRADSVSSSMCGITASLCGIVTEPPPHPAPLIVVITSAASSVSYRSYVQWPKPLRAKPALWMSGDGDMSTGWPKM